MDDDFGADQDFLTALAASDAPGPSRVNPRQPVPQRIQQPTPQRLDRPPPGNSASGSGSGSGSGVKQPTPQALPQRAAGSSILVSPRQKGNPVLACLKSLPWEYSDIPADYGLGLTTCALFLRCVTVCTGCVDLSSPVRCSNMRMPLRPLQSEVPPPPPGVHLYAYTKPPRPLQSARPAHHRRHSKS